MQRILFIFPMDRFAHINELKSGFDGFSFQIVWGDDMQYFFFVFDEERNDVIVFFCSLDKIFVVFFVC